MGISLISCKDDNNEPKPESQLLLTKVAQNGVTTLEFTYNTEKKLARSDWDGLVNPDTKLN